MAIALAAFIVYFALFTINEYNTFHVYSDIAIFAYNLYFNLHYPQFAHGLQYISIDNHISPYMDLMLPFFYLSSGSITLLVIQLITIAAAGAVAFLVTRDLTRDSVLALIFGVVLLFYPGTLGLVVYGSHIEFPIPLFYILMFYFYVKRNTYAFLASSVLFILVAEVTPILMLSFALGMLVMEYRHKKALLGAAETKEAHESKKWPFISFLLVLGVLFLVFYSAVSLELAKAYGSGAYQNLPSLIGITAGIQNRLPQEVLGLFENPVQTIAAAYNTYANGYAAYFAYGFALVLLGFGITLLFVPDVAFILMLPWLAGVFLITGNPSFVQPFSEYFSFVIGPVVCSSILGAMVLRQKGAAKKSALYGSMTRLVYASAIILPALLIVGAPLVYLFVVSPSSSLHTLNLGNFNELLLFQVNASQKQAYSQLYYVIKQVPSNGSLMADTFIAPHVTDREYLELPEALNSTLPPAPDLILIDPNSSISPSRCRIENCTELQSLLSQGNYSVYAKNGTAILYKKN
jgi:uncharacterized membrane protein